MISSRDQSLLVLDLGGLHRRRLECRRWCWLLGVFFGFPGFFPGFHRTLGHDSFLPLLRHEVKREVVSLARGVLSHQPLVSQPRIGLSPARRPLQLPLARN
ncbi:protein of unknown function [Aminobacter niigataensis]|nr:protein of unknown function [Aminobacter niigataensis]